MSVQLQPHHLRLADKLVEKTRLAGGLAPLDLDRFWADEEKARQDPFAADCPQVPLGIRMSSECFFAELDEPEEWYRLLHDEPYRLTLAKRYNDKAEMIVGRRLIPELPGPPPERQWPAVKGLWEIFEGRNAWEEGSKSYWLHSAADTEDELAALLDRVETRLANLRAFLLPPNWEAEKKRLTALNVPLPLYRGQRGPITFAMSIYGAEKLIYLILDNPALAARYRDAILRAILERARILDEEAGHTPSSAPRGWGWADDNCCLLNPDMYEFFGWPILQAVFARYCPNPGDSRYQHSDS